MISYSTSFKRIYLQLQSSLQQKHNVHEELQSKYAAIQ